MASPLAVEYSVGLGVARSALSSYFAGLFLEGFMQSHRSNPRRNTALIVVITLLFAAGAMRPTSAVADGALAVALPPDVVKQGFAYGYVTDYPDADKADAQALKKCRDTTIAGVRPLCTVIQDFKDQCVAVAMDPQAGTPGVGWS